MTTQLQKSPYTKPTDEQILVVRRDVLFTSKAWQGIKQIDEKAFLKTVREYQEFRPRSIMETDPTYKQIIPYLVFAHEDKLFLMQRHKKASEARLQSKFSFGIGGHIRQEDMSTDSIIDWATREFHEEVSYTGSFNLELIGALNDDSNDVGKVHLGVVFLLRGDSDNIAVKSELASGQLMTIDECKPLYDRMESWSQIVFDVLNEKF